MLKSLRPVLVAVIGLIILAPTGASADHQRYAEGNCTLVTHVCSDILVEHLDADGDLPAAIRITMRGASRNLGGSMAAEVRRYDCEYFLGGTTCGSAPSDFQTYGCSWGIGIGVPGCGDVDVFYLGGLDRPPPCLYFCTYAVFDIHVTAVSTLGRSETTMVVQAGSYEVDRVV